MHRPTFAPSAFRFAAACCVSMLLCGALQAQLLTHLDAVISKEGAWLYSDSDGKNKLRRVPAAAFAFPLQVYEQTPADMLRVKVDSQDVWVARQDFKVRARIGADCNVSSEQIATNASRGVNTQCARAKK